MELASDRSRTRRRGRVRALAVGATWIGLVSCSSGADDSVASDAAVTAAPEPPAVDDPSDLFTESPGSGEPDGDGADATGTTVPVDDLGPVPPPLPTGAVSDSVVDPIEPVSDTGVPGIGAGDDFCRAWSEYAGSYQALTFSWAVVGGEAAAQLEVIAHDVLRSAVDAMSASLPDELDAERQSLTVDLPAPLLRRAARSAELVSAEGVDAAAVDRMSDAWLDALSVFGVESEDLDVDLGDDALESASAAAAAQLVDEFPPITEDPSLIVDVQIPLTEQYLFDNCPDRGVLAGNDNVDG